MFLFIIPTLSVGRSFNTCKSCLEYFSFQSSYQKEVFNKGMAIDPICLCCGNVKEYLNHVFKDCSWVKICGFILLWYVFGQRVLHSFHTLASQNKLFSTHLKILFHMCCTFVMSFSIHLSDLEGVYCGRFEALLDFDAVEVLDKSLAIKFSLDMIFFSSK